MLLLPDKMVVKTEAFVLLIGSLWTASSVSCSDGELYKICGGAAAISCTDVLGEAVCECADDTFRGRSSSIQADFPCADYPFVISRVSQQDYNARLTEIELWQPQYSPEQTQIGLAIDQLFQPNYLVPTAVLRFKHNSTLVCGDNAAYLEFVQYRFDTSLSNVVGPITRNNWYGNALYPWQTGMQLGVPMPALIFNETADTQLTFARCGCWQDNGELAHVWKDVVAQRYDSCDNYTEEVRIDVEYTDDPTGVGGMNASDVFVRIPVESVPYVGVARWQDLGLQTINMTCQYGVTIKADFALSPARPHCDWVMELADLQAIDQIDVSLDWCDSLGGDCLYPEERCGAGTRSLLAVCPFDPHLQVTTGIELVGARCSVACLCANNDIVGTTHECDAIERACRGNESAVFCNDPLLSTCTVTYPLDAPRNITFVDGSCAGPPFEVSNSTGCAGYPQGAGNECSDHGVCQLGLSQPPFCICNNGWNGTYCEQPWCDGQCEGAGSACITPEDGSTPFCACFGGRAGEMCESLVLDGTCVSGTFNAQTGKCDCTAGWTGRLCDVEFADNEVCGFLGVVCDDHGTCDYAIGENANAEYVCVCENGWCGERCNTECSTCPDGPDGSQCYRFYDAWHACTELEVCQCAPDSGGWVQPISGDLFLQPDSAALAASLWIEYVVGGPACTVDIMVECADMPPTIGVDASREWIVESFCGDDIGYCDYDGGVCVCPDGYSVQPWGSPKRCVPDTTACASPCYLGSCNETTGDCDCFHPEVWGGSECSTSVCPAPSIPNFDNWDGWTCVCPQANRDPWQGCGVERRCPYKDDIVGPICNDMFFPNDYGLDYPYDADPFYDIGDGIRCENVALVGTCNCQPQLYDTATVCELKWSLEFTESWAAVDAADRNSDLIGVCVPGYSNTTFCNDPICNNGGIHNTQGNPDCPPTGPECCCPTDFTGELCQTPVTLPVCPAQATLFDTFCECDDIWGGPLCDTIRCENGASVIMDECICATPWAGEFCSASRCYNNGDANTGVGCICPVEFAGDYCQFLAPTASPTDSPTKNPTENPTNSPTKNPTKSPTHHPTANPTNSPTHNPTANPTHSPTPPTTTMNPTNSPTTNPTDSPTTSTIDENAPATTTIATGYAVVGVMLIGAGVANVALQSSTGLAGLVL